jgi:hypothetical protein
VADVPWVREGMSLYVASLLVGTPMHTMTLELGAEYGDRHVRDAMSRPEADWFALARDLMDKGAAPAFGDVVRKKATEIGPGDLLLSFALVAYLVEVHEGALPALLAAGADALGSLDSIAKATGLETHQMDAELREWLAR